MASKIRVSGHAQNRTALGIIQAYLRLYPDATISDLRKAFPDALAPDKGVAEIFVSEADAAKNPDHYFTEAEELLETPSGKIAVVNLWTKPSFENLVKKAADYGIEVAEFTGQERVGGKGSYTIEYINGYKPYDKSPRPMLEIEAAPEEPRKRSLAWLWWLLALLAIIAIVLCLTLCHRSSAPGSMADTIIVSNTVTSEIEQAPLDSAEAAAAAQSGAAEVSPQIITALANYQDRFDALEFPVNEFRLNEGAKDVLDSVAVLMKSYPDLRVTVNGYASPEGNAQANQTLSEERAESVVKYLVSQGVPADHLKAVGCGTSDPISKQLPPNRRIEFVAR